MNVLSRFRELYKQLAQLNIEQLEDIYHQDIVFVDPVTTHNGLNGVKHYFANLLANTRSCSFIIHNVIDCQDNSTDIQHVVTWTMTLETSGLNRGRPISLDGTSMLRVVDDKIILHRDYYDVGQMVYENVPVLGYFIKRIKKGLAKI